MGARRPTARRSVRSTSGAAWTRAPVDGSSAAMTVALRVARQPAAPRSRLESVGSRRVLDRSAASRRDAPRAPEGERPRRLRAGRSPRPASPASSAPTPTTDLGERTTHEVLIDAPGSRPVRPSRVPGVRSPSAECGRSGGGDPSLPNLACPELQRSRTRRSERSLRSKRGASLSGRRHAHALVTPPRCHPAAFRARRAARLEPSRDSVTRSTSSPRRRRRSRTAARPLPKGPSPRSTGSCFSPPTERRRWRRGPGSSRRPTDLRCRFTPRSSRCISSGQCGSRPETATVGASACESRSLPPVAQG